MHIEAVVVRFVHGVHEKGASTVSCHARSVTGSGDVGKLQRRRDEARTQARIYPQQRARGERVLARHLPGSVTGQGPVCAVVMLSGLVQSHAVWFSSEVTWLCFTGSEMTSRVRIYAHPCSSSEWFPLGLGPAFTVQGSGFRVQGSGFRVQGLGFGVSGRVSG